MTEDRGDIVQRLQAQERDRLAEVSPRPPLQLPSIPHTALAEASPDNPLAAEWNAYRRIVGRLLAEGHEGRWVLIKGQQVIGIWDRPEDADRVRLQSFPLQPVLMKPILVREPVLRGGGCWRRWAS